MDARENVRNRFWLAVFAAGVTLAISLGAVGWSVGYIRQNWGVLSDARQKLKALESRRQDVARASAELRELEPELAAIRRTFANPADPLPFIEAVEELGRRRDVAVELTVSGGAEEYRLGAVGSSAAVLSFLKAVELLPFLVIVGDAEFVGSGEGAPPSGDRVRAQPREAVRLTVVLRIVPLP